MPEQPFEPRDCFTFDSGLMETTGLDGICMLPCVVNFVPDVPIFPTLFVQIPHIGAGSGEGGVGPQGPPGPPGPEGPPGQPGVNAMGCPEGFVLKPVAVYDDDCLEIIGTMCACVKDCCGSSDAANQYYTRCDIESEQIIVMPSGTGDFIRVNGVCWSYVDTTLAALTDVASFEEFDDCETCTLVNRSYVPCDEAPYEGLILPGDQTGNVIVVDGRCWGYVENTAEPIDEGVVVEDQFDTCEECESASSSSGVTYNSFYIDCYGNQSPIVLPASEVSPVVKIVGDDDTCWQRFGVTTNALSSATVLTRFNSCEACMEGDSSGSGTQNRMYVNCLTSGAGYVVLPSTETANVVFINETGLCYIYDSDTPAPATHPDPYSYLTYSDCATCQTIMPLRRYEPCVELSCADHSEACPDLQVTNFTITDYGDVEVLPSIPPGDILLRTGVNPSCTPETVNIPTLCNGGSVDLACSAYVYLVVRDTFNTTDVYNTSYATFSLRGHSAGDTVSLSLQFYNSLACELLGTFTVEVFLGIRISP